MSRAKDKMPKDILITLFRLKDVSCLSLACAWAEGFEFNRVKFFLAIY